MVESSDGNVRLIAADTGEVEEILGLEQPEAVLGDSSDVEGEWLYMPLGQWIGLCDRPSEFYRTMQQLPEPILITNAEHLCRGRGRSLDVRIEMAVRMLELSGREVICIIPRWIAGALGDLTTATIEES